jgi:hypothetical protein
MGKIALSQGLLHTLIIILTGCLGGLGTLACISIVKLFLVGGGGLIYIVPTFFMTYFGVAMVTHFDNSNSTLV